MTSQTTDDAAKAGEATAAPAVRPGIYLEEKTGAIGAGVTAKTAQYRTFWVTLLISEANVEMLLLNDDFRPTAVRETFPVAVVQGPGWHYIAEGEKRYNKLRPHLDRILLAPAPKSAEAPAKAGGGNWWESGGGAGQPKSAPKKAPAAPAKNNWWSK